jgi:hypothetical protein
MRCTKNLTNCQCESCEDNRKALADRKETLVKLKEDRLARPHRYPDLGGQRRPMGDEELILWYLRG